MRMYKYRFTIVTVCYNAELYIKNTIISLLKQTYGDYEYIIKDGGSTDRTMDIVHSLVEESDQIHIVCKSDKGIYDAMNQAIEMAQGEYIYFLNAGDCFCNKKVLERVDKFIENKNYGVVYGNIIQIDGENRSLRKYGKICSNKLYFLTGDCICHQALFARLSLFEEKKFDTQFQICADKEWQMYHIVVGHEKFYGIPIAVAMVMTDGFSKRHVQLFERETYNCLKKYYPYMAWIYTVLLKIKKNQWILKGFQFIERVFFIRGQKRVDG